MFAALIELHFGSEGSIAIISEGNKCISLTLTKEHDPILHKWVDESNARRFAKFNIHTEERDPLAAIENSLLGVRNFLLKHFSRMNLNELTSHLSNLVLDDEDFDGAEVFTIDHSQVMNEIPTEMVEEQEDELSDADIHFLIMSGF